MNNKMKIYPNSQFIPVIVRLYRRLYIFVFPVRRNLNGKGYHLRVLPRNTITRKWRHLRVLITTLFVDFLKLLRWSRWGVGVQKEIDTWIAVSFKTFYGCLLVLKPLQYWQFHRILLLTSIHKMRFGRIGIKYFPILIYFENWDFCLYLTFSN